MFQCLCEHPRIIINPLAGELIAEHGNYYVRGKRFNVLSGRKRNLYDFNKKNINPHSLRIVHSDIDDCYIIDRFTSDKYPLYLEVPCGKCEVCKASKVNSFVHRCKLETMFYNCKPIFLTLTYDEFHKKECGVCLRDVQLFFKRLRINLHRHGYRQKIRYALVSEYGRNTARPHYHAILWNVHQSDILSYREIGAIIEKSWSNGFIMQRLIDPRNDKAFYYTSKYLRKDCNVPEGQNKTFLVSSNRGGGIGSGFLGILREHIVNTLDTNTKFVNKWNNKVENVQFNRFVLNKVMPTFSRSLPLKLKQDVRTFLLNYQILKSRNNENVKIFEKEVSKVIDFFGQYFYCPQLETSEIPAKMACLPTNVLLRKIIEADMRLQSAFAKGHSFYSRAKFLHQRRVDFLNKLFLNEHEVDVKNRAYNFKRACALAAQREIL